MKGIKELFLLDILIEERDQNLWVAALQQGKLEAFEVDPLDEEVRWGSIYYAKIVRIDAALDAVFLDLDGENQGILFNKDTRQKDKKTGKILKGGAQAIGKTYKEGQMVAVQAKSAYLASHNDENIHSERKCPRMSMDISLPGRYLIHCPLMNKNRISNRIREKKLREQLLSMLDSLEDIDGCILRAAAAGTQTDVLMREGKILKEIWTQVQKHFEGKDPGLIMLGPDAVQRTFSDLAARSIDVIEIVTMDHYELVEEWCSVFAPDLVTKIKPIELDDAIDDLALFHHRDIMGQIEALFQPYVLLPGGGNIIVQDTSALCAIDINSGGDKGSHLSINIEAAKEIARQVRLRNMGGMLLIDFLRMKDKRERNKLEKALSDILNEDPCTTQIHGWTNLGLLELSRDRRTPALYARIDAIEE